MMQQDTVTSDEPQNALSREELEQHLRARVWKDDTFRQEFLTNPKDVLERDYAQYFPEGKVPSELSIKVIEEDEQAICFVLPPKLSGDQISELENIDDEELLNTLLGASQESAVLCKTGYTVCIWRCPDLNRPGKIARSIRL
jgi:hypothetical protein